MSECLVLWFFFFFKVVKYWPETGKSGFLVWRYLLRRDDEEPAPWTKEGKDRMKKLGLTMQVCFWNIAVVPLDDELDG